MHRSRPVWSAGHEQGRGHLFAARDLPARPSEDPGGFIDADVAFRHMLEMRARCWVRRSGSTCLRSMRPWAAGSSAVAWSRVSPGRGSAGQAWGARARAGTAGGRVRDVAACRPFGQFTSPAWSFPAAGEDVTVATQRRHSKAPRRQDPGRRGGTRG